MILQAAIAINRGTPYRIRIKAAKTEISLLCLWLKVPQQALYSEPSDTVSVRGKIGSPITLK
ncbi:hypothetical protein [Nostoc sp.]|uniref:hypothetical protein n=1 Tax=Nostoc sp. TaxID=1180 RepID=UPI002FF619D1